MPVLRHKTKPDLDLVVSEKFAAATDTNAIDWYPPETIKAWNVLKSYFNRTRVKTNGCKTFYTPAEWAWRKEDFGDDSLLIVVVDGSDAKRFTTDKFQKFSTFLKARGYKMDMGYSWYFSIYKAD